MKTNYTKCCLNVALVLGVAAWFIMYFEPESTIKGVAIGFGIVAAAMLFLAFICVVHTEWVPGDCCTWGRGLGGNR